MSSRKFESTLVLPEDQEDRNKKEEAQALGEAFAVLGKMIGEGWVHIDFAQKDWDVLLRLQAQTIAEVLYDYQ